MFLILTREKSSKIEKVKISPFEIKLIIEKKKRKEKKNVKNGIKLLSFPLLSFLLN